MTQYQIGRRIVAVTAMVGLLAFGVAACGKKTTKTAEATPAPASPAVSTAPSASAPAVDPRAATCAKYDEAGMKLFGPFMEFGTAGTDVVKVGMSVDKLTAALDAFAVELINLRDQTPDKDLNDALGDTILDATRMKRAIVESGYNQKKIESLLQSSTFKNGSDKLNKLCAG